MVQETRRKTADASGETVEFLFIRNNWARCYLYVRFMRKQVFTYDPGQPLQQLAVLILLY